jgi:hypothetical protein
MNNDYCQQDDALRIKSISELWEKKIFGMVVGLFSCNSEGQAHSLFEETEKRLREVILGGTAPIKLQHSVIEKDARGAFYSGVTAARIC